MSEVSLDTSIAKAQAGGGRYLYLGGAEVTDLLGRGEARGLYLAGKLPQARKEALLREGECEWFSAVWDLVTDCHVPYGFAERVTIAAKEASVGPTLVRRTPLRELDVNYWGFGRSIDLSSLPWLARVDTLTLTHAPMDELASLGAGDALSALERLTVRPTDFALPPGFADARLPGLRELYVGHVHDSAETLRVLANATHLGSLGQIWLWQDAVGEGCVQPLLRSPHLRSLRRVNGGGVPDVPSSTERFKGVWREIELHSEAGPRSY